MRDMVYVLGVGLQCRHISPGSSLELVCGSRRGGALGALDRISDNNPKILNTAALIHTELCNGVKRNPIRPLGRVCSAVLAQEESCASEGYEAKYSYTSAYFPLLWVAFAAVLTT